MKSIKTQGKDDNAKAKRKSILSVLAMCAVVFMIFASGCGNKFFDPAGNLGRFRPVPSVNVILDSLGVAEETEPAWTGGEEPRPSDTVVMETDYVFQPGDIVRVTIFELLREGVPSINDYVVTETGKISIPDVGVVEAAGLTETQLEEEIRQILSPSILKDPSVTVTMLVSQQRTFSILGDGIGAPGRYVIPRTDFRLTDALATARGHRQFNVGYIFVSRRASNGSTSPDMFDSNLGIEVIEPAGTVPDVGTEAEMLEIITPRAQGRKNGKSNVVIAGAEMASLSDYRSRLRSPGYATADNLGGLLNSSQGNDTFGSNVTSEAVGNGQQETTLVDELETGLTNDSSDSGLLFQEPVEEEGQVSIPDILKTLASRSQADTTETALRAPGVNDTGRTSLPRRTEVSEVYLGKSSNTLLGGPEPSLVEQQESEIDSLMKTLGKGSQATRLDDRAPGVGLVSPIEPQQPSAIGEPEGVESILETLEARTGQAPAQEQAEWENLLESFAQPETPKVQVETEEEMDLDELLKSFAEPGVEAQEPEIVVPETGMEDIGIQIDEQVGVQDVGIDIDVPSPVEEPGIGLDELAMPAPRVGGKAAEQRQGRIEWVFQDGKWVPMQIGAPGVAKPIITLDSQMQPGGVAPEIPVGEIGWATGGETRLIKIPADKLMAGDPRYNIVIKPGDSIYVPVDVIGEFCVMGNVVRQGYIPITGRPLTLKMAIAAAGGLGPLAWPKNVEVVRRIGRKKEEIVMVNLDKIASGEQPDFFIKPNDLINVGTHATSRFRAVLRNAFRATYGFGFIYDRNFALDNYYKSYGRTSRVDIAEAIKIF